MGDREIYEQIRQQLMTFAISLVGPDQAADLVSEAMVWSLRRRSFADLTHPKTYLMIAVLNEAKSRYRRLRHRRPSRSAYRYTSSALCTIEHRGTVELDYNDITGRGI